MKLQQIAIPKMTKLLATAEEQLQAAEDNFGDNPNLSIENLYASLGTIIKLMNLQSKVLDQCIANSEKALAAAEALLNPKTEEACQ